MEPAWLTSSGGMNTIAFFDLELSEDIRMYGMRLIEAPSGKRVSYAPSSGGRRFATFAPALAQRITTIANETYKGLPIASTETKSAG
jgi:hypothetical protein